MVKHQTRFVIHSMLVQAFWLTCGRLTGVGHLCCRPCFACPCVALTCVCFVLRSLVLLSVGEKLPEPIHNPTKIESAKPSSFFPHGIKIVEGAPQPYNPPSPWSWPTDWSVGGSKTAAKPPEIQSSWSPRPVEASAPRPTETKSVLHVRAPVRVEAEAEGAGTAHTQMVWDGMPQTGGGRKGLEVGEVKRWLKTLEISNGDCLPASDNFEKVKTICCGLGSPPGSVVQKLARQAGIPSYCPKAEEKVERSGELDELEPWMALARDDMSHDARPRLSRTSQPQSQAKMQGGRAGDDASTPQALDHASAPNPPLAPPALRKPQGKVEARKLGADTDYVSDVSYRKLVRDAQEVCLCVCVPLRGSACPFAQGAVCGTAVCRIGVFCLCLLNARVLSLSLKAAAAVA